MLINAFLLFRRTDQSANNKNNNFSQSYFTEILPDSYEPTYTILSTSHNYEKPNLCTYIPTHINEDPYNTTDENHLQCYQNIILAMTCRRIQETLIGKLIENVL